MSAAASPSLVSKTGDSREKVGFHFSNLLGFALVMVTETKKKKTARDVPVQDTPLQPTPPRPQESSLAGYDRNRGSELKFPLTNLFGNAGGGADCRSAGHALTCSCGSFYRLAGNFIQISIR